MIVFIGGMPRSGSTFSFNVAREVLGCRGTVWHGALASLAEARVAGGDADHLILKAHAADEETIQAILRDEVRLIVTCREKVEDAAASWMDSFGFSLEETVQAFSGWFTFYRRVDGKALVLDYDTIDRASGTAAVEIARFLVPALDATEAGDIEKRFAGNKAEVLASSHRLTEDDPHIHHIGFSYYDTTTLHHRRHVSQIATRSAEERLGPEAATRIREALAQIR